MLKKKSQFVVLGHLFLIKNRLPHFSIAQSLILKFLFKESKWNGMLVPTSCYFCSLSCCFIEI